MSGINILLLTGGGIHDSQGCGDEIERILRASELFQVTRVHDDLSVLESPGLEPYDAIVFYWTRGELTDAQKNGLLGWVSGGKAFVGVHSATASFRECPEYRAMLGGYFENHPHPRKYQVSVVDPEHPITEGIEEFFVEDEQYLMSYDSRVEVLASALWRGETMPVIWTKSWGNGRVYYLALGHTPECCRDENFETLLIRGTVWAAGDKTPVE